MQKDNKIAVFFADNELIVMNQADADETISYVNKIIDNVRCATCDTLKGSRMRYLCGHSVCDDCVIYAEDCPICTPPSQISESGAKPDHPLTATVQNVRELMKACHNLFDVDVFHHKRLSEQLKIEKELFPKCIQAPVKYENKRRSSSSTFKNKENISSTYFPGEEISVPKENKMEKNSVSYVQQWLNKNKKNLTRKPFTDLNVNTQWSSSKSKTTTQNVSAEKHNLNVSKKRSHFKTQDKDYAIGGNRRSLYEYESTPAKVKKEIFTSNLQKNTSDLLNKCDNDESGIFMDNDPIIIDDSQESVVDKDKKAWLAVLKACQNENTQSTSLVHLSQDKAANHNNELLISNAKEIKQIFKVPFYKRSAITEICSYCKNEMNSANSMPDASSSKPVKIVIDNYDFLTTVTVFKNVQNGVNKNSTNNVSIQTSNNETSAEINYISTCNVMECNEMDKKSELIDDKSVNASDKQSEELFADYRKTFEDLYHKEVNKCIIIEESDSDIDLEMSGPMCVKADVHRSYQELENGTLAEVVNVNQHESKPRRRPRGNTPTSTDSSEKENYNPNRMRRHVTGKKKSVKK